MRYPYYLVSVAVLYFKFGGQFFFFIRQVVLCALSNFKFYN